MRVKANGWLPPDLFINLNGNSLFTIRIQFSSDFTTFLNKFHHETIKNEMININGSLTRPENAFEIWNGDRL